MIDYWEAIGRLATYNDLNGEFLKVLPPAARIESINVRVKETNSTAAGLNIPGSLYTAVQNFFGPILTEQYLSLMSAGELIWAYSYNEFRDAIKNLQGLIAKAQPELYGPSTHYFITLGIAIVDDTFRDNLRTKEPDIAKSLRRLSTPESEQIVNLASDPKFDYYVKEFAFIWDGGCDDRLLYWPGHLHPLGINEAAKGGSYRETAAGEKY